MIPWESTNYVTIISSLQLRLLSALCSLLNYGASSSDKYLAQGFANHF